MTDSQWNNYKNAQGAGSSISLLANSVDKHMLMRRFGAPMYSG